VKKTYSFFIFLNFHSVNDLSVFDFNKLILFQQVILMFVHVVLIKVNILYEVIYFIPGEV
jgi:hypothetical protein